MFKCRKYEPGSEEFEKGVKDIVKRYTITLDPNELSDIGLQVFALLTQKRDPSEVRRIVGFKEGESWTWAMSNPEYHTQHKIHVYGEAVKRVLIDRPVVSLPSVILTLDRCEVCDNWLEIRDCKLICGMCGIIYQGE